VTPAAVESTQNLAIILGVVIPLSCAVIVLIFLHRRHVRKQRQEDINDPHKSLDFGMDGVEPLASKRKGGRKGPEMTITDLGAASSKTGPRGLSMDMNMSNPYLLPAGLTGSRETLHSMTRNTHDEHDPYRPITLMRPSMDNESVKFGRLNDDKGSLYSMSTGNHSTEKDKAGLLANARPMSQTFGKNPSPSDSSPSDDFPLRPLPAANNRAVEKPLPEIQEREILVMPPATPEPIALQMPPARSGSKKEQRDGAPHPPRKDSMASAQSADRPESSNYGDDVMPSHRITINEPEPYDINPSLIHTDYHEFQLPATQFQPSPESSPGLQAPQQSLVQNNRLSVMGLRPLPSNLPEDNPEVRANRIRSFYKEYFDDSKPGPAGAQYENEGYMDFLDGVIFDPDSGGYYAAQPNKPFAQGPGRRAMTPPPRGKPRVSGNSGGPHGRKFSVQSMGRPRGRSLPRKKLPPPKPLNSLMTPHLMKDDSAIFHAADFAPPSTFRNMQNGGRPDSPMGVSRPYSPMVRAFTPLASSFDNLTVLPSPHDLRKSGTFTGLDFAPPSKIRDPGSLSPSDAGSIRSNRSGVSAMQSNAIRAGAYRVSRIPSSLVTTNEDLNNQLRPSMNMTNPA